MTALAGQFWLLGSPLKQRQMTTTPKRGEKNVNKGSKEHTKRGKIERPSMDSGAFPPANSTIVGAISMLRIGLCKKRTFVMPRENTSPQTGSQSSSVLQHLTPEGFNRVTVSTESEAETEEHLTGVWPFAFARFGKENAKNSDEGARHQWDRVIILNTKGGIIWRLASFELNKPSVIERFP